MGEDGVQHPSGFTSAPCPSPCTRVLLPAALEEAPGLLKLISPTDTEPKKAQGGREAGQTLCHQQTPASHSNTARSTVHESFWLSFPHPPQVFLAPLPLDMGLNFSLVC